MNPNVEKAVRVLGERLQVLREFSATSLSDAASKLDSAGLLVTPLHERALKACEDLVNDFDWNVNGRLAACWAIGRESLASKKMAEKAERWTACSVQAYGSFWVRDSMDDNKNARGPFTLPEARAVADALNKLEDKP